MRPSLPVLYSLGWPPTGVIPLPEHYQLIAGYVTISTRSTEEKDDCGNVKQNIETITRDWASYAYDIRAQTINGVKKVIFIDRGTSASGWDGENENRMYGYFGVVYSNYGPIRPGLTYQEIKDMGVQLADANGPYSYFFNNCETFATNLYGEIS